VFSTGFCHPWKRAISRDWMKILGTLLFAKIALDDIGHILGRHRVAMVVDTAVRAIKAAESDLCYILTTMWAFF
jgi:hypothetical protein